MELISNSLGKKEGTTRGVIPTKFLGRLKHDPVSPRNFSRVNCKTPVLVIMTYVTSDDQYLSKRIFFTPISIKC